MTIVGEAGPGVRGDVQVSVQDARVAKVRIKSTVQSMYGQSLQAQVEDVLSRFGKPAVHVKLDDSGALPFVVEARLEAALSRHLGVGLPPIPSLTGQSPKVRPRRTRLYVPGNQAKLLPNAALYRPDSIVLDLEDAVAPEHKYAARALVRRALATLDWQGTERIVRINSGAFGMDDLAEVAPLGVDALLLPKVESPEYVQEVASRLDAVQSGAWLIPLLESAKGMIRAYEIATASERVAALAIGMEDYVTDIRAERSEDGGESAWARGQVVNSARAAGVQPLASVYPRFDDDERVYQAAMAARVAGFDGMGCIHPSQIRPTHRAFSLTPEERTKALAIVEAFEKALASGAGVVSVGGRMVDAPVYQRAKSALERSGC
jgi:citrate lyase subunit beta/citryl-CoA lyase